MNQMELIEKRSITLFLKKESDFSQESTVELVKGISQKTHFVDPKTGEPVDVKDMDFMEIVKRNLKRVGVSGWHRFEDAFERHFAFDTRFAGGDDVNVALDEAFEKGQNDFGQVFAEDTKTIRSVSVGDVFEVQGWSEDGGNSVEHRWFIVADAGFIEFNRATGELV